MAHANRALPPGMLAYLGPAALQILFINYAGQFFLWAVHRSQARPRPYRSILHELLMPMSERLGHVSETLKQESPWLVRVNVWKFFVYLGARLVVAPAKSAIFEPLLLPILFHPIDARIRHCRALPLPSSLAFADGTISTLVNEQFYVRALEPAIYLTFLRHLVRQSNLVRLITSRACTDPYNAGDWEKIHELLVEEHEYEPHTSDSDACHASLRQLYTRRFDRWFLNQMISTLIEKYMVRSLFFPLEMLYTRLCCTPASQVPSPYLFVTAVHITATEGVASLYSGYSLLMGAMIPHVFTMFAVFMLGRSLIAAIDPAEIATILDFRPPEVAAMDEEIEIVMDSDR